MKKTLTLFLVVLSLAALAGCSDPADAPAPPVTSSSVETSTPETDNPLLLSDFEILDVISGGGSVIGTRGSVYLEKASLPEFSSADFSTYFTEFVENRVDLFGLGFLHGREGVPFGRESLHTVRVVPVFTLYQGKRRLERL